MRIRRLWPQFAMAMKPPRAAGSHDEGWDAHLPRQEAPQNAASHEKCFKPYKSWPSENHRQHFVRAEGRLRAICPRPGANRGPRHMRHL